MCSWGQQLRCHAVGGYPDQLAGWHHCLAEQGTTVPRDRQVICQHVRGLISITSSSNNVSNNIETTVAHIDGDGT